MEQIKEFRAGLYIRLSREDGKKGTSDSILNQEKMLKNFVEEKEGISLFDCYIDEDYTGTNFNRPAFQRMVEDIKVGLINCVILKDLSRLGRNFIESSKYIEEFFPEHNCRFISVLDNVDSFENPDINTDLFLRLKNLIHDNNSQEISKKVRAVKDMQRREGKHIGSFTPYGYKKDPKNKYRLIIDNESSYIVRRIFDWYINGIGIIKIAERLNRIGVLSPGDYKRKHGIYKDTKLKNTGWYPLIIRIILTTRAYIGDLDQKRVTTRNYKDRKTIYLKEKDHIIVHNTHEPIIKEHIFYNVQEMLKIRGKRTSPNKQKVYLFSGLMRCHNCNSSMIRTSTTVKKTTYVYYKCRSYNQRGKSFCHESHSIREELIYTAVKHQINTQISNLIDIKRTIANYEKSQNKNSMESSILKAIEKDKKQIEEFEKLKCFIYSDFKKELLTEIEFKHMKDLYSDEIKRLKKNIVLLKEELVTEKNGESNKKQWIEEIIEYGLIFTLDREIVTKLIDKIYVSSNKQVYVKFKYENMFNEIAENLNDINPDFVGGMDAASFGN